MKCSKCGYLGFESGERCRNCGYEFSLAESYELPDATMRVPDGGLPLLPSSLDQLDVLDDDTPLITKPSPPRTPLAVRRSTPDAARIRAMSRQPTGELALDLQPAERTPEKNEVTPAHHQDASVARRGVAALLDLVLLLAVDLVVVYFTMQICGVSVGEVGLLPKGPLVAFLLVQNVGYLIAFTAGGQTLGKMAAGIKVVAHDCDGCIDVPCALKRTMLSLVLAAPAGLGLLPTLFDRQHRGLHDRFAGTRVVRASA